MERTNQETPSAGALRAARRIMRYIRKVGREVGMIEKIAGHIDRETHAGDLAPALRDLVMITPCHCDCNPHAPCYHCKAAAALKSAGLEE